MEAFDELGGTHQQPMALQKALENKGWHATDVVDAINAALEDGELVMTQQRSLTKP
jgi:hypothetical protein